MLLEQRGNNKKLNFSGDPEEISGSFLFFVFRFRFCVFFEFLKKAPDFRIFLFRYHDVLVYTYDTRIAVFNAAAEPRPRQPTLRSRENVYILPP